jgi:hypothetical protein
MRPLPSTAASGLVRTRTSYPEWVSPPKGAEHLPQRARLVARGRPNRNVGDTVAGAEHCETLRRDELELRQVRAVAALVAC